MFALLREEPLVRARGWLALLMFAALNIFWSALTLALSAPPYQMGHATIGAFGLAGVAGALGATAAYAHGGWPGVCLLGAAVSLLALACGLRARQPCTLSRA